jgi:hypothetical protein
MSLRSIATCLTLAAAGAAPLLAHSAPRARAPINHVQASAVEAAGTVSTPQGDYNFTAKSYTELDGSRAGSVFLENFAATGAYQFVSCTGPEFANAAAMNQSTGAVSVNTVIDLSAPNCFAFNYSGAPLTVSLSGQADGNERLSENGAITQQLFGESLKFNFQSDTFSEVFTGTIGLYTGAFAGRATSSRSTNRTR